MAVFPGARVRDNGQFGAITDNPLLVGATVFNSPDLAFLSTIISDHAVVTLDPLRRFGAPEIVVVTTHTAASTTATITRGAYGTLAREHPQGTEWVHAPIDADFVEVVTSGTRPSDQYESQLIYETDTGRYQSYSGTEWRLPHNPPACRVYNTTDQSIPSNSQTAVTFNSEFYDTDSMHSTSLLTSRVTINMAGVYVITGHIAYTAGSDYTYTQAIIRRNGTDLLAVQKVPPSTSNQSQLLTVATTWKFTVGEYIELTTTQVNGATAARNLLGSISLGGNYGSQLAVTWIGIG